MSAALTRRERRVKQILLRELERMNEWNRLTYVEKQHLDKHLDVAFIDRELEKMKRQLRWSMRAMWILVPVIAAFFVAGILSLAVDYPSEGFHLDMLLSPLYALGGIYGIKSLRRKIFIYQALRELSDAEEEDVMLDQTVHEADRLIQQIVDRELVLEEKYPLFAMKSVRLN